VLGVGLLALLLGRLRRRGWPTMGEPGVVPVLLALVALASLVTAPVQNGISRQVETRADVDALRATGDSAAFTAMQRELALRSLADPTPMAWSQSWFGSHPTVLMRIALAVRMDRD
jgi:STE24 endopeptidase